MCALPLADAHRPARVLARPLVGAGLSNAPRWLIARTVIGHAGVVV